MNFLKASALALLALFLSVPAFAQVGPSESVVIYNGTADPCAAAWIAKSSTAVNISTATTTQLAVSTGTQRVYACGFKATMMGTLPTALFVTGTGSACGTGTVSVTGTYAPTAGSVLSPFVERTTNFISPAASQVCVTSGGTSPSIQGIFVYVLL